MTRLTLPVTTEAQRETAVRALNEKLLGQFGFYMELRGRTRSQAQNDRLWPTLRPIARTQEVMGKKWSEEQWKCMFMEMLGCELQYLPKLDGTGFFPAGFKSSKLLVPEFSDLLELIHAYAAENGIQLQAVRSEQAA
ncbi:MAG: recombination protein NinB [Pseudomonadota bacterium]